MFLFLVFYLFIFFKWDLKEPQLVLKEPHAAREPRVEYRCPKAFSELPQSQLT